MINMKTLLFAIIITLIVEDCFTQEFSGYFVTQAAPIKISLGTIKTKKILKTKKIIPYNIWSQNLYCTGDSQSSIIVSDTNFFKMYSIGEILIDTTFHMYLLAFESLKIKEFLLYCVVFKDTECVGMYNLGDVSEKIDYFFLYDSLIIKNYRRAKHDGDFDELMYFDKEQILYRSIRLENNPFSSILKSKSNLHHSR